MTNGEKFKTAEERHRGFKEFCLKSGTCRDCPLHCSDFGCRYAWLDLEYKEELKPCPFCGSENIGVYKSHMTDVWYASCNGCGCRIDDYTDRDLAINTWNRRVNEVK